MLDLPPHLLAAINESDPMGLLLAADWLEDHGDERAAGLRWMHENDKSPRKADIIGRSVLANTLLWDSRTSPTHCSRSALPLDAHRGIKEAWYGFHPTASAAYLAAAAELAKHPEIVSLKGAEA